MSDKAEQRHTKLPWVVGGTSVADLYDIKVQGGRSLASTCSNPYIPSNAEHDAEFIVLACNNHYKLVVALEALLPPEGFDGYWCVSCKSEVTPTFHEQCPACGTFVGGDYPEESEAVKKARQALAEVKS